MIPTAHIQGWSAKAPWPDSRQVEQDLIIYPKGGAFEPRPHSVSDPVALLNHLFLGAPAPPAPFGECGVDPTVDGLGCEAFGPCV